MKYSDFIGKYKILQSDATNFAESWSKLYDSDYDGIEFTGTMHLENKKETNIVFEDIIYNITCDDGFLYYIINKKIYPIKTNTRFIKSCSIFTNISFGVISCNNDEKIPVKYNRIMLKSKARNEMIENVTSDNKFTYNHGNLYLNI